MSMSSDPTVQMNHVFVDFENVHEIDLSVIGTKSVHLWLLLGPRQTKLDTDLVEKLIMHSTTVQFIRLKSQGKNALDFTLAYYVGRTASAYPTSYIHIVSKDTGFDPLIEHLKSRQIRARRHDSFASLSFKHPAVAVSAAPKSPPKPEDDPSVRVLEQLGKNIKNRPKKKKTLLHHIQSQLGKDATEAQAAKVFETLCERKHLSLGEKNSVEYNF